MNQADPSPIMVTDEDRDLFGGSSRGDAMGLLAIWSVRGRDLVPHLTEQTTNVRGFQILVEAYRLWEKYEPDHSRHAGQFGRFFLLVEQAFARTVGWANGNGWIDFDWNLPGARRVRARAEAGEVPRISYSDTRLHLLGGQGANGIWGLYRGAARRAGLLTEDMARLSRETSQEAERRGAIDANVRSILFPLLEAALDGGSPPLPNRRNNPLTRYLYETYRDIPLHSHFRDRFIVSHDLTRNLAKDMLAKKRADQELDRRSVLERVKQQLPAHREAISNVERCEDLLSVVDSLFLWLCASNGKDLEAVAKALPDDLDLDAVAKARTEFGDSGSYSAGKAANDRHRRLHVELDTSSKPALLGSVLELHERVSSERGRAPWVWEEQGRLRSDVEAAEPPESLRVGAVWRNGYYLGPLRQIALQLEEAHR